MIFPTRSVNANGGASVVFLLVSSEDLSTPVPNAQNLTVRFYVLTQNTWTNVNPSEVQNIGYGWYSFEIPQVYFNNEDGPIIILAEADGTAPWRDIKYVAVRNDGSTVVTPTPVSFQITGTFAGQALPEEPTDGGDSGDGEGTPVDPTDPPTGGGGDLVLLGPNILEGLLWTFHDRGQGGVMVEDAAGPHVTLGGTVDNGPIQLYTTVPNFEAGTYHIEMAVSGPGGPLLLNLIQHGSPYGSLSVNDSFSQSIIVDGTPYTYIGQYKADSLARVRIMFPAENVGPGEWYDISNVRMRRVIESA